VTTFAVCLACVKSGGKSLGGAYRDLLVWLGGGIAVLAAIAGVIAALRYLL
jgi:hypothetical protein